MKANWPTIPETWPAPSSMNATVLSPPISRKTAGATSAYCALCPSRSGMTSVFFPVAATVVPPSSAEDLLEARVGMAERAVVSGVLRGPGAEVGGRLDRGQPRREVVVHEGTDEVPGHQGRLAPRVDGDEEPDAFLLEQPELAVEVVRVPAVPDEPPAVHVRLVEAQAGSADGGLGAEDARVHGAAVSGFRMRASPSAPSCRCAIMKRDMSVAVAARDPAGPKFAMNS